jgi:hypothetical protein
MEQLFLKKLKIIIFHKNQSSYELFRNNDDETNAKKSLIQIRLTFVNRVFYSSPWTSEGRSHPP